MEILTKKYILSAYDEDTHLEIVAGNAGTKTVGIMQMITDGGIMAIPLKDVKDVDQIISALNELRHEMSQGVE